MFSKRSLLTSVEEFNTNQVQTERNACSLRGKKIAFEKIIGMIDDLVAELKVEQEADEKTEEHCKFLQLGKPSTHWETALDHLRDGDLP